MVDGANDIFRQVIVVGLPGFGAGAQADAGDYRDLGADTLGHVSRYMGGLQLPLLQWLGLGNVTEIRGVDPAQPPAATHGRLARATPGRDPEGAMDELIGPASRALVTGEVPVHAVGAAAELIGELEGVVRHPVGPMDGLFEVVAALLTKEPRGLFIATPASDRAGAPVGPVALARALQRIDGELATLLDLVADDALVLVAGLGGDDATIAAREGATRELSPLLAYTPALPSGIDLGTRDSLADVGATVAEVLGAPEPVPGASFLGELLA